MPPNNPAATPMTEELWAEIQKRQRIFTDANALRAVDAWRAHDDRGELIREVQRLREEAARAKAEGWFPIESAPFWDTVWAIIPSQLEQPIQAWKRNTGQWLCGNSELLDTPLMWHPFVPTLPQPADAGVEGTVKE